MKPGGSVWGRGYFAIPLPLTEHSRDFILQINSFGDRTQKSPRPARKALLPSYTLSANRRWSGAIILVHPRLADYFVSV